MKLKALKAKIDRMVEKYPEALEMDVMQTSCFDDPYRFETSDIWVGETYRTPQGDNFNNDASAIERIEEDGDDGKHQENRCVVIEAY